jgi:hypothetical protein
LESSADLGGSLIMSTTTVVEALGFWREYGGSRDGPVTPCRRHVSERSLPRAVGRPSGLTHEAMTVSREGLGPASVLPR